MGFSIKDLAPGNESLMTRFEDEDTSVSIEQSIEVETATAEEENEAEEVSEEIEESNDDADAAEEGAELYARLEYMLETTEKYGLSQPLYAAFNFNGELAEIVPGLPAVESLGMTASPGDAASQIACEGFKETMEKFWEWVKRVARKIWNFVTGLASRIVGLFSKLDATCRRLAQAIAKADIDPKQLADKKIKAMPYKQWQFMSVFYGNSDAVLSSVTNIAEDTLKKIQSGQLISSAPIKTVFNTLTGSAKDFISIENDTVKINNDAVKKAMDRKEDNITSLGWDVKICSNSSACAQIYALSKTLPKIAGKLKSMGSTVEAAANRYMKMSDASGADSKTVREGGRTVVKLLTTTQKICNMYSKGGFQLIREFIRVQRAIIGQRGLESKD